MGVDAEMLWLAVSGWDGNSTGGGEGRKGSLFGGYPRPGVIIGVVSGTFPLVELGSKYGGPRAGPAVFVLTRRGLNPHVWTSTVLAGNELLGPEECALKTARYP